MLILPALANRTNIRPAWNLFSTQQDIEMGRLLADDAERVLQVVDQPNAAAYIDALGKQLSVNAARFPYQFKIVNDDNINMWALPGGYIYVTSGLVETAQNEQELAGAVAHAIAHVVLRHGTAEVSRAYADQVQNSSRYRISVNDAMSGLKIRFEPRSIPLTYSREEERQADVIATQILYDARFDPQPMTDLFQAIAGERSGRTTDFLDAHPEVSTDANVRTELRNLGGLPGNLRGDSPDFHSVQNHLSAANTGPFSGSARNSAGAGNRPQQPSTRMVTYAGRSIEFRYPDNWRVSEETDSITVAPYDGFVSGSLAHGMRIATFDAQDRSFGRNSFVTPGARPDNSRLANATDQLIDQLRQSNPNMRVIRNRSGKRVDGAQAMVVELTNDSPAGGTETDWLVTVFDRNGLMRYFIGVSPEADLERYQPVFDDIVASARFLD